MLVCTNHIIVYLAVELVAGGQSEGRHGTVGQAGDTGYIPKHGGGVQILLHHSDGVEMLLTWTSVSIYQAKIVTKNSNIATDQYSPILHFTRVLIPAINPDHLVTRLCKCLKHQSTSYLMILILQAILVTGDPRYITVDKLGFPGMRL